MPMQVILTEDVPQLGNAGDVVNVKPGFARNYLMPQGKAMLATEGRVREIQHQRQVIEEKVKKEMKSFEAVAKRLSDLSLEFKVQAGEEGKLFGSVTNADIAEQLTARGFEIDRRRIELSEPIKLLGDYEVEIKLHREVKGRVKVQVVPVAVEG
jgi:large subunit ribosomal protein L9